MARRLAERYASVGPMGDNGNESFMEPLVIAWLTQPMAGLDLVALLSDVLTRSDQSQDVAVLADDEGIVELPGLGEFGGNAPHEPLLIRWCGRDRVLVRRSEYPGHTTATLQPLSMVPGTSAVLAHRAHPLLERFYVSSEGYHRVVETAVPSRVHAGHVVEAFSLVAQAVPALHAYLARAVRRVTVHRAGPVSSFATPAAHGAIFVGAQNDETEIGIAEDLVHQGGHVAYVPQ